MADQIIIETTSAEVIEVGVPGPQGPAGAAGTGLETLTTQGDTLYRGASTGQRLPIGTTGQILRVSASGIPEWGAAPASGVTSVNGATGAVTVAAVSHSHQPGAIYCDAVDVSDTTLSSGEPNGIYFRDGSDNGKAIYKSTQGYALYWDDGEEEWVLGNVAQSAKYYIGTGDTEHPWQATSWALGPQGSGDTPVVDQALLSNYQRNAAQDAVSARTPKTGNASSTQVVLGNDTRLSDARTPSSTLAHAASHAAAGSDPVFDQDLNTTDSPTFAGLVLDGSAQLNVGALTVGGTNLFIDVGGVEIEAGLPINFVGASAATNAATTRDNLGLGDAATADIGTGSTQVALGNHTHGNLTNDGKVGSTAGLPLVTTTAGAVTALALGTAGQILRTKSDLSGVEFADPAAAGVTGAASSASDVLGVSGANITGVDATADRIVFWDDSASKLAYLEAGSGLSLSGTTLSATGVGVTAVGASTADVLSVSGSDLVADDGGTIDSSDPFIKWDDTAGKLVYANPLSRPSGAFYVGLAPTTTALGTNSVNIQSGRDNAAHLAKDASSVCVGYGARSTSSTATAIGHNASCGNGAFAGGGTASASNDATAVGFAANGGTQGSALGRSANASGFNSVAIGYLISSTLRAQFSVAPFSAIYWGGQTTNATPLILNLDATATNRFTIAASTALAVDILLVARRSDTQDKWLVARRFLGIRRDGSNNTSLIGSVQTLGTDQSAGSPTWTFALTADDTNEALQLEVTGAASETIQWRATAFYRVA